MYDEGSNPSVALFTDARQGELAVVAVHHGKPLLSPSPLENNNKSKRLTEDKKGSQWPLSVSDIEDGCGSALPYDGIVMDSWPLPNVPHTY